MEVRLGRICPPEESWISEKFTLQMRGFILFNRPRGKEHRQRQDEALGSQEWICHPRDDVSGVCVHKARSCMWRSTRSSGIPLKPTESHGAEE